MPSTHWLILEVRSIKITFGLCSTRNSMEIDRALFWYLRIFFGHFTHLNCPSLCYNLMIIITDTFLHFSLNKLHPFVVVVTCLQNIKWNKVATKVKTFKYRQQFFFRKFSSFKRSPGFPLVPQIFLDISSWFSYPYCAAMMSGVLSLSSTMSSWQSRLLTNVGSHV